MEVIDSMKWLITSQHLYRLAVFRIDKSKSKVVTGKRDIFWSLLFAAAISAEVAYVGHKVYFEPAENFFQTSESKL